MLISKGRSAVALPLASDFISVLWSKGFYRGQRPFGLSLARGEATADRQASAEILYIFINLFVNFLNCH